MHWYIGYNSVASILNTILDTGMSFDVILNKQNVIECNVNAFDAIGIIPQSFYLRVVFSHYNMRLQNATLTMPARKPSSVTLY